MGCQTEVYIGDDLVFTVNTHDPETGEAMDAAAPPTYRVYENETATPILTGTMAKLEDVSTTGFYAETIACTAVNGFEHGKSYAVYIEATVDGHPGTISYNFRAVNWPSGTGAFSATYTVTLGGLPLDGVYCRMTTDLAGLVNIDAGYTNALGQVVFHHDLPSGTTVYVWRVKAGVEFTDPDQEQIP